MAFVLAPLLLTALGISATATAFTLAGVAVTALQVASFLVTAALTVGLGLLAQSQRPKLRQDAVQNITRQTVPVRLIHYGEVPVGGAMLFEQAKGARYHMVLALGQGRYVLDSTLFGETPVTFNGAGQITTPPWGSAAIGVVRRAFSDGASPAAFPALTADFPEWDADHKLLGITACHYMYVFRSSKTFQKDFPQGKPSPRHVIRRHPDFVPLDTRTGTRTASDNAGMVIRDYLMSPDGFRIRPGRVYEPSFTAFASMSDEARARRGGGSEKAWRIDGTASLDEQCRDVLAGLSAACDARVYIGVSGEEAGKVCISGGQYRAPRVTLTLEDIEEIEWSRGSDLTETKNEIRIRSVSKEHNWNTVDAGVWRDEAAIARDGRQSDQMLLRFCRHPRQAQRLARIAGLDSQTPLTCRLTTTATGMDAFGEETLRIVDEEAGYDVEMRVTSCTAQLGGARGLDIALRQTGPPFYAFDPDLHETPIEPPPSVAQAVVVIEVPVAVTLAISSVAIDLSTRTARIRASWTAPVEPGLEAVIRYRRSLGGGSFDPLEQAVTNADDGSGLTGPVAGFGDTYEVTVSFRRGLNEGEISPPQTIVANSDDAAPAAATITSATGGAGQITVGYTLPNSANVAGARLWRNTSNSLTGATLSATVYGGAGQAFTRAVTGYTAGTGWVLVQTFNGSDLSGAAASQSATVT